MAKKKKTKKAASKLAKRTRANQELPTPSNAVKTKYPVIMDFTSIEWGNLPPREVYGAYATGLYADVPDLVEFAAEALVAGTDDKDVDLCHVDRESGQAYVVQTYVAETWGKAEAPANKADDLLNGLSWLLNDKAANIPVTLRPKALELQDALASGEVELVHLLYVHNCENSDNVRKSLETVERSARTLIQNDSVRVNAKEIGIGRVQHLYDAMTKQIIVDRVLSFDCPPGVSESGDGWKAVATTISGSQLHELWRQHGNDLFSANIRSFLDMLNHKTSINRGILETVQHEPTRFWAYNNGITILTKKLVPTSSGVKATGISVINGAQTTGVIGNAPLEFSNKVRVPCRFIQCTDPEIVLEIIESNNTQNAIKSFDLRSNDQTQRRLKLDFGKYGIIYKHRREGSTRIGPGGIQAEVVAPYLAAFHGRFQTALRQRRSIFEDRSEYGRVFPNGVQAEHVYLVQCLADAIVVMKTNLKAATKSGDANDPEALMSEMLQYPAATLFVVSVVGQCLDLILGGAVTDRFSVRVRTSRILPNRDPVVRSWGITLETLVPLITHQGGSNLYEFVRSQENIKQTAQAVSFSLQAIRRQTDASFAPLREASESGA